MASPSHKALKRSGLILASLFGVAVIAIGAFLINAYFETRDPLGPRVCECELLKEWAAALPLTPTGSHLEPHDIEVLEYVGGFEFGGSGLDGVVVDRQALTAAFTEAGINHRVDADRPDEWVATFFPGANPSAGTWSLQVSLGATGIGFRVSVAGIDGSAWGLETADDLWNFYREDYELALAAQEDRQRQAVDTLRPMEQALNAMIDENG